MKNFKKVIILGLLGTAFLSQAAEVTNANNLNKIFVYFSDLKNSTNKDLFIIGIQQDGQEGKAFILKPGKSIKNIPVTLSSMPPVYKNRTIKIVDEENKELAFLRFNINVNPNAVNTAQVLFFSADRNSTIIEEWQEYFNIEKVQRAGIGIVLDLKGDYLLESNLDVVAELQ